MFRPCILHGNLGAHLFTLSFDKSLCRISLSSGSFPLLSHVGNISRILCFHRCEKLRLLSDELRFRLIKARLCILRGRGPSDRIVVFLSLLLSFLCHRHPVLGGLASLGDPLIGALCFPLHSNSPVL